VNKIKLIIAGSGVIFVVLAGMYFVLSSDEDKFPPPLSPDYVEEYPIYVSATPAENTGNVPTPTLPAHEVTSSTNEKPVVIENPVVDATMSKEEFFEIISGTTTPLEKIDTSDWKTYRDDEYGFEIKYSPQFELEVGNGNIKTFFFSSKRHKGYGMVATNRETAFRYHVNETSLKEMDIIDINGIAVRVAEKIPHTANLYIEKNDTMFIFSDYTDTPVFYNDNIMDIVGMINSFRFIENE
jgi:hypothetical protein